MNSCATGLIVRFLRVMIPTGKGGMDNNRQNLERRKICAKAQQGIGQKAQKRSACDQRADQMNRASRHASRCKCEAALTE